MAAPIPGLLYVFQIQCDDLTYFATYSAGKLSYKPDWIVDDPIPNNLFLRNPNFYHGLQHLADVVQSGFGNWVFRVSRG
jgi:hypothetical protein